MKNIILAATIGGIVAMTAKADGSEWIGNVGDCDWNVSTNWSNGVPTGGATAVFPRNDAKQVFRLEPPTSFTGVIVTTNDLRNLQHTHPTYLELVVPDGATWSVSGCGTVIATEGIEGRLASDFVGTVCVPSDVSFTVPASLSPRVAFTGCGELRLDSAERIKSAAGFSGTLRLPAGEVIEASDTAPFRASSLSLGDGASLSLPEKTLAWGAICDIPDWNTAGAWSFNADNTRLQNASTSFNLDARPPFVTDDGDLRLVNGPAQSHSAFYTNRMFKITDDWGVNFTFVPELPNDSQFAKAGSSQTWEGYFGFYLQSVSPTDVGSQVYCSVPSGYGTAIYLYRDGGLQHTGWHLNADAAMPMTSSVAERLLGGIVFTKPIDYSITCVNGVLAVTMRQEGKSFTMRKPIAAGYLDSRPKGVYIGFGGACSWWSDTSVPWTQMTIRGFSGWYRAKTAGAWRDIQSSASLPFSAENWYLYGYDRGAKAAFTGSDCIGADGKVAVVDGGFNTNMTAACLLPLCASNRYLVSVNVDWGMRRGSYDAEGFSIGFVKRKPVSHWTFNKTSGWTFDNWTYNLMLRHYLYDGGYLMPYLGYYDNKGVQFSEYMQTNRMFVGAANSSAVYEMLYDPSGDIEWQMSRANGGSNTGAAVALHYAFDREKMEGFLARKGEGSASANDMYLAFCGSSSVGNSLETKVGGITVKELVDNNSPMLGGVSVDAGATATISAGASFPASQTPAVCFDSVKLADDSVLNVSCEGQGAHIGLGDVSASGSATIYAADGVTVDLGSVSLASGVMLTLSGTCSLPDDLSKYSVSRSGRYTYISHKGLMIIIH